MDIKQYLILVVLLAGGYIARAQSPVKTHHHQDLIWVGYYPKLELSRQWAVDGDLQLRRKDWGQEWSQKAIRTGASYRLNENLVFSGGIGYVQHHKNGIIQKEYRPYQQIIVLNNFSGIKLDHRYRFEQRWLERMVPLEGGGGDNLLFNYRLRYKVGIGVPVRFRGSETSWSLYADNEILVNLGEEVFINLFDQNRFSLGLAYQLNENIKVQLGYMNLYAQKAKLGEFDDADIIRLNFYHKFSLSKQEE